MGNQHPRQIVNGDNELDFGAPIGKTLNTQERILASQSDLPAISRGIPSEGSVSLGWAGQGWAGLGWARLVWSGLGWAGIHRSLGEEVPTTSVTQQSGSYPSTSMTLGNVVLDAALP